MAEKIKYFDRILSKRGLNKFDTSLLTNDGGKYSPSIRRFRQHYFHDRKKFSEKLFSSSSITTQTNHLLKCNDCQKYDGLFQCCHCNQHLCIRCCNKHYKKVTNELEHLHELNDHLLTKIYYIKTNLEKQKIQTIEQCHQWRIETINKINQAHTFIIQTIHNEYEILCKKYDLFIDKEMSYINIDKNELLKMKKSHLANLISSTITKDSKKSMDLIKQRIQTFDKRIDNIEKFSFQVKLPTFNIDDNLRVESYFGDRKRSTSAIWQNEDFVNDIPSTKSEESSSRPSIEKDTELQSGLHDSAYGTASSSSTNSLEDYSPISISSSLNDNEDAACQIKQSQKNDEHTNSIEACRIRQRTASLSIQSPSLLTDDYPWIYYRTNSTPSFIQ